MSHTGDTGSVAEARQKPRFLMHPRVPATFSGVPVSVLDLSISGLKLEHAAPMRIATSGSIHLETEENPAHVTVRGRVVWSKLSCVADRQGKLLYQSGVRLDAVPDSVAGLFGRVIHLYGERDARSILTKRAVMAARTSRNISQSEGAADGRKERASVCITADDVRMIRQAERMLKNNPDQASKWLNRARYSAANRRTRETPDGPRSYPTDVIVIWEYLAGKVDLDVIARVREQKTDT